MVEVPFNDMNTTSANSSAGRGVWLLLALLLATNVPLFLCLPITDDATLYDLEAREVARGRVLYRDVFEPNLPGIVWLHGSIRRLLGPSSIALRVADLAFLAGTVGLLSRFVRREARGGLVLALALFYLSISEWCHCQRDAWMLLPALAALALRGRQIERLRESPETGRARRYAAWGAVEGACWGAAVWIKPLVVVPAFLAWLTSALLVRRRRPVVADFGGLLLGGLAVGGLGIGWLVATGAWPHFVTTFVEWNPRYVAAGREHWTAARLVGLVVRLFPWSLLHLAAAPLALVELGGLRRTATSDTAARGRVMLAALYLGWLVQSFLLQHLFDYVHVPAVLLAIALLTERTWRDGSTRGRAFRWAFLVLALLVSPTIRSHRLAVWPRCFAEGSSAEVRNRLAHSPDPDWRDLERVADYLRTLDLRDGELTCLHNNTTRLYVELGLRPSTRYPYLESMFIFFPDRHDEFFAALEASPQRFVVTNLCASGLSIAAARDIGPAGPDAPPPAFLAPKEPTFPWSQPVVFRAGSFLVHRVSGPLGPFRHSVPVAGE